MIQKFHVIFAHHHHVTATFISLPLARLSLIQRNASLPKDIITSGSSFWFLRMYEFC